MGQRVFIDIKDIENFSLRDVFDLVREVKKASLYMKKEGAPLHRNWVTKTGADVSISDPSRVDMEICVKTELKR